MANRTDPDGMAPPGIQNEKDFKKKNKKEIHNLKYLTLRL